MAPRPALLLAVAALLLAPALPTAAASDPTITIPGFSYSPARLEVAPGATVTVVNQNAAPHSVTAAQFDSGVLDQGESAPITAPTTPGEYPYQCSVHGSSMKGTLVVADPAAATTTPASPTPTSPTPASTPPATTQATPTPTATPPSPAAGTPATPTPAATPPAATSPASATPTPTDATQTGGDAQTPAPGLAILVLAAAAAATVLGARRSR